MKKKFNPDDDGYDPSEEYFKRKEVTNKDDAVEYFPIETSKPPHY